MAEISEQFALFLVEACKQPDIRQMIAEIASPKNEQFSDAVSVEVHRQIAPLKQQLSEKDAELQRLRNIIRGQQIILNDLEQHRRDSLRISGIPENPEHDNTDEAVLKICNEMKLEPQVEPKDIAVSHRVGKSAAGRPRQILVKLATRNVRERVFKARTELKNFNKKEETKEKHIYVNEDLTRFRAGLAKDARSLKNNGNISDTWTMYGKILVTDNWVKDNFGHVKVITKSEDLQGYN